MKSYSGATCASRQNLQMGVGAFFKNFDMDTDLEKLADAANYAELLAEKGLGATQGGGNFTATPTTRQIAIDDSDPITVYDSWTVTMAATILEMSARSFEMALGSGVTTVPEGTMGSKYKLVRARRQTTLSDYIDNITWIGMLLGYDDPVIIQIFNAISTSGVNINVAPNANATLAVTFTSSADLCTHPELADYAPFNIYFPTVQAWAASIKTNGVEANGVTATGAITPVGSQPSGTAMSVAVTLTGMAAAAGTHTIGLTSATAEVEDPLTVTKTVTAGQAMTAADVMTFNFEMPAGDVYDLAVTNTFAAA